jgi:hypothetical protein
MVWCTDCAAAVSQGTGGCPNADVLAAAAAGELLLQQGKEVSHIYFLIEGNVEVFMDVPNAFITTAAPVGRRSGSNSSSSSGAADHHHHQQQQQQPAVPPAPGCQRWTDIWDSIAVHGSHKVVLGVKGPGSILGDDAVRVRPG